MIAAPLRRFLRLWPALLCIAALSGLLLWQRNHPPENAVHSSFQKNQREYIDHRGIHVVVAHYIGDGKLNGKSLNITRDLINSNNFYPIPNEGKNGQAVVIAPKDLLKMQQVFQINRFNLLASDRIPLNRTLPDVRKKRCQNKYTDISRLPTTSVIIVFHNEAWSTLMRTVWSVINRSPKSLIREILLVDDASERDFLRQPLDDYVLELPIPTRVIRSKSRVGLVKARLMGAKVAQGEVLTFLDAHCECTIGWLESMLDRISENRKTVVCPVIDIISDDTFAYIKSFELHWGAFNWELHFRWFTLGGAELKKRKKDIVQPFYTPAMAGGLFSMDKNYFFELGAYDEDMQIWGGENLELSFRVWQCGGTIEIVPCSHVGHLFRKSSPYTFPGGVNEILYSNLARVASVWMDEWADFFYKFHPRASAFKNINVDKRLQLRRRLKCKSFKWYLNHVWPQHFFPMDDRFFGRIRNLKNDKCLTKPVSKGTVNQPVGVAVLNSCLNDNTLTEIFVMTSDGVIMTDESVCLDAPEKDGGTQVKVRITACNGYPRQKWKYNNMTLHLQHAPSGLCLDEVRTKKQDAVLTLNKCGESLSQQWKMDAVAWK